MRETQYLQNDYHMRREAQERAAAQKTGDSAARKLHLELAERYAELTRITLPGEQQVAEL
jgi:hypothetical protein